MNLETLIVPILADVAGFEQSLDQAQSSASSKMGGIGSTLSKFSKGARTFLVAGAGAIATAVGASTNSAIEWGNTLDGITDVLGSTSAESAGLALMAERVGGSTDQLTGAMSIMTRGLFDAEGGLGTTGQALENLGISVYDAEGNVKSATQLFSEIATTVGNMPDGLEKTSVMMDIFGRSGSEMGDLLGAAADGGLDAFIAQAGELGLAMSPEQVEGVVEFGKKTEEMKQTLQGLAVTIGSEVLPAITPFIDELTTWLQSGEGKQMLSEFVTVFKDDLLPALVNLGTSGLPVLLDVVKAVGDVISWFANLPAPVQTALGVFTGLIAFLPNLIGIFSSISGVVTTVVGLFGAGGGLAGVGALLSGTVLPAIGGAIAFLVSNPIGWLILAIVAVIAIIVLWGDEIAAFATKAWEWIKEFVTKAVEWVGTLVEDVGDYLTAIWDSVTNTLGKVATWLSDTFKGAWEGISNAIQGVIDWVGNLINKFADFVIPDWLTPGSPTPFELGLRGISDAMRQASKTVLPKYTAQLSLAGMSNPVNGNYNSANGDVVQLLGEINSRKDLDADELALAIRDAILQVV